MLPARHRMRRPDEFSDAVRRGARSGARRLVVHLSLNEADPDGDPALVGFVVPKSVGTAVRRNRVKRRLRALARERLPDLPAGARLVVRALPDSAGASSPELAEDLDAALAGARRRIRNRSARSRS
ncbi:ribonuclease P protein component [Georgenia sp. AZ-5]|uniref:ribonuclease P protein component n=1 Tax=Georgenia sp. AZ-5 TaxID=3367526 RepID=UPI003755115F